MIGTTEVWVTFRVVLPPDESMTGDRPQGGPWGRKWTCTESSLIYTNTEQIPNQAEPWSILGKDSRLGGEAKITRYH